MLISGETARYELTHMNLYCLLISIFAFGAERVNAFSHAHAFSRIFSSDLLIELWQNENIAHDEHFLLLP